MKKIYYLGLIYETEVEQNIYESESYPKIFKEATKIMRKDKMIKGALIFSNKGTAIVIKPKHSGRKV
jgi:hypothetical protein